MTPLTLHITGMTCSHCLNAVNQALREVPGVRIHTVQIGRAEMEYDEARVTPGRIIEAVADAGYQAAMQ